MRLALGFAVRISFLALPLALSGCSKEAAQPQSGADGPGDKAAKPAEEKPEPTGGKDYVSKPGKKAPSPLLKATKQGNLDTVRSLLESGADPSPALDDGLTPLHVATGEEMVDIAGLLLDKGADPNAKQVDGATPLHIAATLGNLEIGK